MIHSRENLTLKSWRYKLRFLTILTLEVLNSEPELITRNSVAVVRVVSLANPRRWSSVASSNLLRDWPAQLDIFRAFLLNKNLASRISY